MSLSAERATTPSNVLDDALSRVRAIDPALALTLSREVESLRDGRKFGLVFENHLPESVRLPGHPIKRGVKVALRNPSKADKDLTWTVARVTGTGEERVAHLVRPDGTAEIPPRAVSDLVVVRDFGEPVYPGLKQVDRIERGGDAPFHTVINGENHHVLQALLYTHRKSVDLIYIDPPYNTGNEGWIYNDRYVAEQDGYKHSKWLSFMERRLKIARDLLKDTGVIFVAIGDDEHHRLRMLMDQVFGKENFLADIAWQGRTKNDKRFTGGGVDYMVAYARRQDALVEADTRWVERKQGVDELLRAGREAFAAAVSGGLEPGDASVAATAALRTWIRNNKNELPGGLRAYQNIDSEGRVYQPGPLDSPNSRPNLVYDVMHPVTGRPVPTPAKGWRVSRDVMAQMIANNQVVWGRDHTVGIRRRLTLDDDTRGVPAPTFSAERDTGTKHLEKVLGDKRFPFPKDHEVLMRWFRMAAPKDAVILDFFGGSGTTTEAVLRLNAEDGGTRRSILVTNNEVAAKDAKALTKAGYVPGDAEWEAKGVFEYVTRPRISTVVTGVRPDGSSYSDGLDANVAFFQLTYLDESRIQRAKEFEAVAPLLWLRAGGEGDLIAAEPDAGWALTDAYGVLTDIDAAEPFIAAVLDQAPSHVFVVTDSASDYAAITGRLPSQVQAHQLYESYLRNFEINKEAL